MDDANDETVLPFEFRGDGFEYFKIWIVNILLTILTLGIYSAWAKVRTNRYFYANMYLGDESFRYLAEPITILKGRIVAVTFFLIYLFAGQLYPPLGIGMAIVLMIAMPWLVVRSIAFNNRMSAYRNIQFRFHGDYREAGMALFVWPLLGVLTLGLLYPLAILKTNQFIVKNSAYGTSEFDFDATFKDYGMICLMFIGGIIGFGLAAGLTALAFEPISILITMTGYAVMIVFLLTRLTNLYYNSTTLIDHSFDADLAFQGLFKTYAIIAVLTVLTLGLYMPFAKVRLAKYKADHISFIVRGSIDQFIAAETENINALGEEFGEVFDFDIGVV